MAVLSTYAWFLAGALMFGVATRAAMPSIGWIALVVLLHASRSMSFGLGIASLWIALYIGVGLTRRGAMPIDGPIYFVIVAVEATVITAAFALDRIAAPASNGVVSTLILPLALTAIEFLRSRYAPSATWGSIAYSQYGWLPLMQVVAVTGIWGITFLLGWVASTFELAWSHGFQWNEIKNPVLICAIALVAILAAGQARIFFAPTERKTVRVATLNRPVDFFQPGEMSKISSARLSAEERVQTQAKLAQLSETFLRDATREARAGARLVVWPEQNLLVFKEDEPAFLEKAKRLASAEHIYLAIGMGTIYVGDALPFENKLVFIDPSGQIRATHLKTRPVFGWEASVMKRGTDPAPIITTEYGRMAGVICFEADFPEFVRAAGSGQADLLVVPANEWKAIKDIHYQMQVFRAIETGVPIVRAAASGISAAIDPWGRALSTTDFFAPGDHTMVAQLPTGGLTTLYSKIGDVFAWLCVAGVVVVLAARVMRIAL